MAGHKPDQKPKPKRVRRTPQRTCVGCRTVNAKRQLVRLVRTADGQVVLDPTGKAAGRGAYLHARRSCWDQALASQALEHALRMDLTDTARDQLRALGAHYSDDDAAT